MTLRAEPLIPWWGVVVAEIVVLGGIIYAIAANNWIGLVVLSMVLLFILGGDVAAMIRAWRGIPDPVKDGEPGP